jgi:NAD+ kinase
LVLHADYAEVKTQTESLMTALAAEGIETTVIADAVSASSFENLPELVVVLGGDGTILKAVEFTYALGVPILGVNMGRVGFLAEAEHADIAAVVSAIVQRSWTPETRVMIKVEVHRHDEMVYDSFALNEVAIEKVARELMTELRVSVDGSPLMTWAGDGLVVSTPTGSTAYAFSAGGPVIWPTANVLLAVPISAHALFAKPIVVSPESRIDVEVLSDGAMATLDGRRRTDLLQGDFVQVTKLAQPLLFARVHSSSFTQRLVAKFRLPTVGWREMREDNA